MNNSLNNGTSSIGIVIMIRGNSNGHFAESFVEYFLKQYIIH